MNPQTETNMAKTTAKPLPKMTVEARESTTVHGIPKPNTTNEFLSDQLQETIAFNAEAKVLGWQTQTLKRLIKYIPFDVNESDIMWRTKAVTGFEDWQQVSQFVVNDKCTEFWNLALKYVEAEGQKPKEDKDFIDGTGLGYNDAFSERARVMLQQCFNAKYYYRLERPLEYAMYSKDLDLSETANAIHPGHWSYPAGHGTKFLTAVEVLNNLFHLDKECYRTLLIAACVLAMGRSGNLIHYPFDNLIGGKLTTLVEFN